MKTETIQNAASIVAPVADDCFRGSLDEAVDAMVTYAGEMAAEHRLSATQLVTRHLANSQPERVAEICAVALLRLAGDAPAAVVPSPVIVAC